MLDEIFKKNNSSLACEPKTLFLSAKIRSSDLEGKHHGLNYFGIGY
jgi:hypothetical protein